MIIVTGGAGFIGSAIVWKLNQMGINDIIITDILDSTDKWKNLVGLGFVDYIDANDFLSLLKDRDNNMIDESKVTCLIHMGADTNTLEKNAGLVIKSNFEYSKKLALWCRDYGIKMIYASSASTYGDGSQGFADDIKQLKKLHPLNPYGYSKHLFDLWLLKHGFFKQGNYKIVGLKFSNVFGPNEYHKEDMRSMICKGYEQLKFKHAIKLFKSCDKKYKDGESFRNFIYIKDLLEYIHLIVKNNEIHGIFNLGSKRVTWNYIAECLIRHTTISGMPNPAAKNKSHIEYIDMPEQLRNQYQYDTSISTKNLDSIVDRFQHYSLDMAIKEYVQEYLEKGYHHYSEKEYRYLSN